MCADRTTTELWRPGDFETPDDPARWFSREAALWSEIGFGNGDFLCDLAADHPEVNVLGIETSPTCHRKALKQARERKLSNLQLVLAPAEFVLRDIVPRQTVGKVYINFPSPWPKSSHEDRRLLDEPFWTILADRVAGDGPTIQVTTDRADYLAYALDEAENAGWFDITHVEPPPAVQRTKYAGRARQEGRAIQTVRAARTDRPPRIDPRVARVGGAPSTPRDRPRSDDPADETQPSDARPTMHHAVLTGRFPPLDSFEKRVRQASDRTAILLDCFEQVGQDALVFVGQTNEPDLEQQILIEVVDRRELEDKRGDLLVRMRPFNRPLVTEATRMAVDMVVDLLVDDFEVAEVVDRKY